jgi:hypothetical protein
MTGVHPALQVVSYVDILKENVRAGRRVAVIGAGVCSYITPPPPPVRLVCASHDITSPLHQNCLGQKHPMIAAFVYIRRYWV